MSHPHPAWLVAARTSPRYLNDAWNVLYARQRQREQLGRTPARRRIPFFTPPENSSCYSVAIAAGNGGMNRYFNVLPYDHNRVRPQGHPDRYLNASWVKAGERWWIAYQSPVPNAAHAFLSTILLGPLPQGDESPHDPIRTIVQLTLDVENGRKKADPYFPSTVGETWCIPPEDRRPLENIEVTVLDRKAIDEIDCVETTLKLNFEGAREMATVRHLRYTGWPDFGVPEEPEKLFGFVKYVQNLTDEEKGPVMVGCSAGIGRTGTFIATSSLLRKNLNEELTGSQSSPLGPIEMVWPDDKVVREVDSLRDQRGGMVQKPEQMELIYELLARALE